MNNHETKDKQRQQLRSKLRAQRDSLTRQQLQQAESDLLAQLQSSWASLANALQLQAERRQADQPQADQLQAEQPQAEQSSGQSTHLKIAGFLASGGEISLASSLQWLREQNHSTYLPIVRHQHLMFAKLDDDTQFTTGKYNIDIPVFCEDTLLPAAQLDIVFLPLVGFDLQGGRIGMGGGYYDRTFAFLIENKRGTTAKPLMLGVAHEFQRQQKIPVEHWDVPIAGAITDQASYSIS